MGLIVLTDKTVPTYDEYYLKKVKEYDDKLDIYWNEEKERWALRRYAENAWHHCFFLNEDDGSYRPVDNRILEDIWECDLWKNFGNDENAGGKLHEFIQAKRAEANLKEKNLRAEYLTWYNKEHKKDWAVAIENMRSKRLNDSPNNTK